MAGLALAGFHIDGTVGTGLSARALAGGRIVGMRDVRHNGNIFGQRIPLVILTYRNPGAFFCRINDIPGAVGKNGAPFEQI